MPGQRPYAILDLVPYQTPCPKCLTVGFVSMERVINGGVFSKSFYCGHCDHEWHLADPVEPPAVALPADPKIAFPKPRTRRFGPNR